MTNIFFVSTSICVLIWEKSYELLLSVKWGVRKWNIHVPRDVGKLFECVIFGMALNAKFNQIPYQF